MAKIWATLVAETPFNDSHIEESFGYQADKVGNLKLAKTICTMKLVKMDLDII